MWRLLLSLAQCLLLLFMLNDFNDPLTRSIELWCMIPQIMCAVEERCDQMHETEQKQVKKIPQTYNKRGNRGTFTDQKITEMSGCRTPVT